jgi:hypothetical protein
MGEDHVHVVFGAGQVGRALTSCLAGLGLPVRVLSRQRPPALVDGVDWRATDATDPEAATAAVKGRTRAAMTQELLTAVDAGRVRIAIGRAADFFGAGITTGTTLGERVFANAVAKRADFIGNPDLPHTATSPTSPPAWPPSAATSVPWAESGTFRAPRPSRPDSCWSMSLARSDTRSASARYPSSPCAPSASLTR